MSDLPIGPRVALISGGTVGIGAAISEALLAAGYRVAANYADRHAAADAFATRTGIPVFAWNVAELDACLDGVARVQASLGPVDVLVNNAGITRDAMLHKMTATQWREVKSVPAGRLAAAAEIARGVVFLVADDAAFVNGITLSINGGKYMS